MKALGCSPSTGQRSCTLTDGWGFCDTQIQGLFVTLAAGVWLRLAQENLGVVLSPRILTARLLGD